MRNLYQNKLDEIKLTSESKYALTDFLAAHNCGAKRQGRKRFPAIVAAAAAVCILATSAAAIGFGRPILEVRFQNGAGYQQSMTALGQSVTQDGWTMTLTDSVMDEYNIYIGIEIAAPEGTVLDQQEYHFDDWDIRFPGLEDLGGASHYEQVRDSDPADNKLQFILWATYSMREEQSLNGETAELCFDGLYHNGAWNEETCSYERIYDFEQNWSFTTEITLPENVICLTPNVPVHTLDVDATITRLEVTPIGVYVYITGDTLKGHHDWVPRNAPDGWYGCVEYQEITLYLTDGTAIPMTEGMSGSGCSGGTDPSEPGSLRLARRGDTLIDMDALDYITVCGVEISLRRINGHH